MARALPATSLAERRCDDRYQRLMAATRDAAARGYDAVSMRDLARSTRLSMTTIYQFCASKDHLIAEAHLEWMEGAREVMEAHPIRGRSPRVRMITYTRRLTDTWTKRETLMRTLLRAIYSIDPGVAEVRASLRENNVRIMELALGSDPVPHRADVIEILGQVIDSVSLRWVSGTIEAEEARKVFERTVKVLIPS